MGYSFHFFFLFFVSCYDLFQFRLCFFVRFIVSFAFFFFDALIVLFFFRCFQFVYKHSFLFGALMYNAKAVENLQIVRC